MATVQGYNQVVAKTTTPTTPTINASGAAGGGSKPVDFTQFNKGLGDVAKMVDYMREQKDTQTAFDALNQYNQTMNSIMYDENNGLCRLQGSAAEGISQSFIEQEKEAREKLMNNYKFYNANQRMALNNAMDKITTGNMKGVADWEYKQGEVARATTLDNSRQAFLGLAQNQYMNVEAIMGYADIHAMQAGEYAKNKGAEAIAKATREARGTIIKGAMSEALAKEDFAAFEELMKAGGDYLDANDRLNFDKVSYQKQNDNYNRNIAQEAFNMFPDDPIKAKEYIKSKGGFSGSVKEQAEGTTWVRKSDNVKINLTAGNAKQGFNAAAELYHRMSGGDRMFVTSAQDAAHQPGSGHYNGRDIDIASDWLENADNRHKFIQALEAQGIKVYDEYENDSQYKTAGHLHINLGDYKDNGVTREADPAQVDKAMSYYNKLQSEKHVAETIENRAFFKSHSESVRQLFEAGTNQAQLQQYVKQQCGNDLKKANELEQIINGWQKVYGTNFTIGGISGKAGGAKQINEYGIREMLRNGQIPNEKAMLSLMAQVGANPTQTSKYLEEWNKWFTRKGAYSVDMQGIKAAVFGKANGLGPAQQIQWRGVEAAIVQKANEIAVREHRDITPNEMVTVGREAIKNKVYYAGTLGFGEKATTDADAKAAGISRWGMNADGTIWIQQNGIQRDVSKEEFEMMIGK